MSLAGKTLFITGASRGIGLAIGLRAARDGANVAIAAKTAEPHPKLSGTIYTAAEDIERAGGKALPLVVDVRDEAMVKDALDETAARFGGIDIVVNNASAISLTPVATTDMKRFDLMHQINTRGTFVVSKWAIPHLEKAANPHILMISPPLDMQGEMVRAAHRLYHRQIRHEPGRARPGRRIARQRHCRQCAVAAHGHRHGRGAKPARRRCLDASIAQAGDHGRRGLCRIHPARARTHRPLSHRRYVLGRNRRQAISIGIASIRRKSSPRTSLCRTTSRRPKGVASTPGRADDTLVEYATAHAQPALAPLVVLAFAERFALAFGDAEIEFLDVLVLAPARSPCRRARRVRSPGCSRSRNI